MIVRLMGEGQYRLSEDVVPRLNELDDQAQAAVEGEDEARLDTLLDQMWQLVRDSGERLPDDDLSTSDAVVPPSDMTLEETKRFLNTDGLIPDLG
jgi:ABC-type transporter Mla subunit MlaD